jgi:hypothetical protein
VFWAVRAHLQAEVTDAEDEAPQITAQDAICIAESPHTLTAAATGMVQLAAELDMRQTLSDRASRPKPAGRDQHTFGCLLVAVNSASAQRCLLRFAKGQMCAP